jgi:hypothetical protein
MKTKIFGQKNIRTQLPFFVKPLYEKMTKFRIPNCVALPKKAETCKGGHTEFPMFLQKRIANVTAPFKKYKQLFEYQHLLLLRDIWWSKF